MEEFQPASSFMIASQLSRDCGNRAHRCNCVEDKIDRSWDSLRQRGFPLTFDNNSRDIPVGSRQEGQSCRSKLKFCRAHSTSSY
jgi:hypothetical protein